MSIRKRRCSRCGDLFEPAKQYHRLCASCNQATYTIGFTSNNRRTGGADRMHGGHSRLRDGTLRRPLALRGSQGREAILEGLQDFAADYYGHTAGLSTIFERAGCDYDCLQRLGREKTLNNLLMDFYPAFRSWVFQFAGDKAMELIVDWYGLYGDNRLTAVELAYNLDLENAGGYRNWVLKRLREDDARMALEELSIGIAAGFIKKESY